MAPKPVRESRVSAIIALAKVSVAVTMTVFEILKEALLPSVSRWGRRPSRSEDLGVRIRDALSGV